MGGLHDTEIEAEIHEIATLNIIQEREVHKNYFNPENNVYYVLGQEGTIACEFLPCGDTINSATYCKTFTKTVPCNSK